MVNKLIFLISFIFLITLVSCSDKSSPIEPASDNSPEALEKWGGANSAVYFDGVDDFIEIPDHPSLDITDGLTVAAWVYINEYREWASVVTKGGYFGAPDNDPLDNNYTIHQSGPFEGGSLGHIRFTGSPVDFPAGLPESNTQIPLNEWHHIAVTFNGSIVRFYLDGVPDGQTAVTGPLTPNDNALRIGVDVPGIDEYWSGMLDEVKIWNRPLSIFEIFIAKNFRFPPRFFALCGYWNFNESAGVSVEDNSRFGNDGELMNGASRVSPGAPTR